MLLDTGMECSPVVVLYTLGVTAYGSPRVVAAKALGAVIATKSDMANSSKSGGKILLLLPVTDIFFEEVNEFGFL